MRATLGTSANRSTFLRVEQSTLNSLKRLRKMIAAGICSPSVRVRHVPEGDASPPVRQWINLGVFPIAANPLHWAHLLGGLLAMEKFALDKVIYVVAGADTRKLFLAPEVIRHSMAKAILDRFFPLLEYCGIARGGNSSGEENLFRVLALNPHQRIHAYYIVGGDHYHRFDPATGLPDTIQKLEQGIIHARHGYDKVKHPVSVILLDRGLPREDLSTFLDVRWLNSFPLHTSSTSIRSALAGRQRAQALSLLPYTGFLSICENHLYETIYGEQAGSVESHVSSAGSWED